MSVQTLLSVDSVSTGIGCYTLNLMAGLLAHPDCELSCFRGMKLTPPHKIIASTHAPARYRSMREVYRHLRALPGAYRLRTLVQNRMFCNAVKNMDASVIYHEPNYILKPFDGISVASIHDLSWVHYPQYHPRERVKYMERELPRTIARARHFITDSDFVKHELVTHLGIAPERITSIPLGVSADFHPRTCSETAPVLQKYALNYKGYLLSVATQEPRKNLEGLLNAYMRLPQNLRRDYPLVLAGGRGWQCHKLEKRLHGLETQGKILRPGFVSPRDLPHLYAGAAAFAFPSFYEGFGLPPLEAMASGTPVVVAGNSAMAEVVSHAGVQVDACDPEAISVGLQQLLSEPACRSRVARAGVERAAGFTWDQCVNRTMAVYRQIQEG